MRNEKKMKRILYPLVATVVTLSTVACDDFLDRSPFNSLSATSYFTSEKDLELYAAGLMQNNIPSPATICYGDQYADIYATNISTGLLYPGNYWTAEDQTGWESSNWKTLRAVNYMLLHMERCRDVVSEEIYNHYEGVARFWRAWFYYGKVRTFGNVPWYEEYLESDDYDQLHKTRDDREYVMDKVLEDLTFAAENCLSTAAFVTGSAHINK